MTSPRGLSMLLLALGGLVFAFAGYWMAWKFCEPVIIDPEHMESSCPDPLGFLGPTLLGFLFLIVAGVCFVTLLVRFAKSSGRARQ